MCIRDSIYSADGLVLANTETDEAGNETRVYPYGNMFAHVVGYDSHGKNGIEALANFSLMTSHNNYIDQVKNEILEKKNPGDNVITTLNTRLQEVAYKMCIRDSFFAGWCQRDSAWLIRTDKQKLKLP